MRFHRIYPIAAAAAIISLTFMSGCGGNAITSLADPQPVSAQQNYSNASLAGTYSFSDSGIDGNGHPYDGSGILQLDGNGNIAGSFNNYYIGGITCRYDLVGTYTLSSSASGQAQVSNTSQSSGCGNWTATVQLQAAQQGQAILFAESDGAKLSMGTALKQ